MKSLRDPSNPSLLPKCVRGCNFHAAKCSNQCQRCDSDEWNCVEKKCNPTAGEHSVAVNESSVECAPGFYVKPEQVHTSTLKWVNLMLDRIPTYVYVHLIMPCVDSPSR